MVTKRKQPVNKKRFREPTDREVVSALLDRVEAAYRQAGKKVSVADILRLLQQRQISRNASHGLKVRATWTEVPEV
jgi:hypothetical protein